MTYINNKNTARGFTIVELLVVIFIIGLLASIVIVNLSASRIKSRDAKRVTDLKTLQVALENYYVANAKYPCCTATDSFNALVPAYLLAVPRDPSTNAFYLYTPHAYGSGNTDCTIYRPIKYHLGSAMELNNTTNQALARDDHDILISTTEYPVCSGAAANFHGTANNCVGGSPAALGADNCYDLTN